jgi:hypothetical protein
MNKIKHLVCSVCGKEYLRLSKKCECGQSNPLYSFFSYLCVTVLISVMLLVVIFILYKNPKLNSQNFFKFEPTVVVKNHNPLLEHSLLSSNQNYDCYLANDLSEKRKILDAKYISK